MEAEASSGMGCRLRLYGVFGALRKGKKADRVTGVALRRVIKLRVDEKGASGSLLWQK